MNDLDSRARAILEAARDADDPSPADRNRIRHAVLVQLAAGAVASTAVAGTMTVGMKLGVAVLAVSLVGGGAAGVVHWRRPHGAASVAAHALVPVASARHTTAPTVAIPEIAMPPVIAAPSVESQARRPDKPRKLAGQISQEREEDQLNAEVAVLKGAREDLRLGRPAQALEALREYDRRFGKGTLDEERQAMAAIAACQAHPGPSARAQAQAFMLATPHSPLLDRVRVTCITPTPGDSP